MYESVDVNRLYRESVTTVIRCRPDTKSVEFCFLASSKSDNRGRIHVYLFQVNNHKFQMKRTSTNPISTEGDILDRTSIQETKASIQLRGFSQNNNNLSLRSRDIISFLNVKIKIRIEKTKKVYFGGKYKKITCIFVQYCT